MPKLQQPSRRLPQNPALADGNRGALRFVKLKRHDLNSTPGILGESNAMGRTGTGRKRQVVAFEEAHPLVQLASARPH